MKTKITLLVVAVCFTLVATTSVFGTSTIISWMKDMYNQPSIKPQESGTMQNFPLGTVSIDGKKNTKTIPNNGWMAQMGSVKKPAHYKVNMVNGKRMFQTYCEVCHGDKNGMGKAGKADTRVAEKFFANGVVIPAGFVVKTMPANYLYLKIKHGGIKMPALGYMTTEQDRWDIINYLKGAAQ
ncbi:MAG: mono/diheme cytochrome c family protein [bacterium]